MAKRKAPNLEEQLRRAVLESGRSQQDLGRASGVSQGQLSRFLRGERTINLRAAAKLCQALGLSLVKTGE